ncbi:mushroom body large-type Kenyon cell-specific protein 1-like isoform X1 [Haliotis cracherodii]|uniref:mushroom body large-type Kenyon cell-specific protein 1-like isoform X1 n=1 Tax=Haliotis cracherodii TaxID=6455 RepID=UPI0039E78319
MVDCGSPQCAQERRNFRKELLSWSKKIPVTIALEKIAEEFAGKDVLQPVLDQFNSLEPEEISDWVPEEECFYCEGKLPLIDDVVSRLAEDVKNGRSEQDNPSVRLLQELLPYCPQFYTHGLGRDRLDSSVGSKQTPTAGEDSEVSVPSAKPHVELKIPHIPLQASKHKKDCTVNGKKSYTDDELTAAVHDIRSGKLGTRRAAMLYGIPRSTLRNKIFKLESEDALQPDMEQEDSSSAEDLLSLEGHSMKLADLMQASAFTYTLPPLPFALPFRKDFDLEEQEEEFVRRVELLRRKHNLDGSHDNLRTPAHANELKMPLLVDLIRRMVEQRLAMERQSASVTIKAEPDVCVENSLIDGLTMKNPFLPSSLPSTATCLGMTAASLADIRIPSYKPVNGTKDNHTLPDKPMAKVYESSTIGETLKNIIVRSINEKIRFRETREDSSGTATPEDLYKVSPDDMSSHASTPITLAPPHAYTTSHSSPSPPKRHKKDSDKDKSFLSSSTLKKTRPKRGQYRKYNSQLLMEAVRAVQRGEMSVHRAGSYFGVPHSTLEYKVKERHLLRQKKPRETTSSQKQTAAVTSTSSSTATSSTATAVVSTASDSNSSNSSITSASTSTTTAAAAAKSESAPLSALGLGAPKQSSSGLPWFQPYLNGSPHFDPAMGFFHSGFALNTPASELLRKLQHKVQSKSGTFPQDNTFDLPRPNGVGTLHERFLLFN